jgi:hypothetical protein
MKKFNAYSVVYDYGDGSQVVEYRLKAANAPHSFSKCARAHPDCRLREAYLLNDEGRPVAHYLAPSQARVEAEPVPESRPTEFVSLHAYRGERGNDIEYWSEPHGIRIRRPV